MNIVIDLDGTLIDSRQRLFQLFRRLVPASTLDFDEYWRRKREGISHESMLSEELGLDAIRIAEFVADWMRLIETSHYLALDRPFDGVGKALAALAESAVLHLCTDRQDRAAAIEQLQRLELLHYFEYVLATGQVQSKQELLLTRLPRLGPNDWFVADTGADIMVARKLGIKSCAVLSGFRSRAYLERHSPDRIVDGFVDFRP